MKPKNNNSKDRNVQFKRRKYHDVIKRRNLTINSPANTNHENPKQSNHKSTKNHTIAKEDIDESLLKETSELLHKPYNFIRPHKRKIEDHVSELRRRALWSVIALIIGGVLGYRFQNEIISFLVKPLGQQLFYSSPTGGLDFLVKICLFFGFLLAIPVIVYNLFKFIEPAIPPHVSYKMWKLLLVSILLALAGASFAYFISLPSALYFLSNFNNEQVTSLISAQEYFNFVILYIGGFAALFQMPLLFHFANKITPLQPKKLIKKQRVVILLSFIIAAILTPTPDPFNQTIMAAPIIALYQTSVGVVWKENSKRKSTYKRRSI